MRKAGVCLSKYIILNMQAPHLFGQPGNGLKANSSSILKADFVNKVRELKTCKNIYQSNHVITRSRFVEA